jgi:hypothetical protein
MLGSLQRAWPSEAIEQSDQTEIPIDEVMVFFSVLEFQSRWTVTAARVVHLVIPLVTHDDVSHFEDSPQRINCCLVALHQRWPRGRTRTNLV